MQITLEIRDGLNAGYFFTFDNSAIIGRDPACDLVVTGDPMVSRRHARVRIDGKRVFVEDIGSQNGTRIGRQRIQGSVELDNGQQFRVGRTHLLVTWT